METPTPVVLIDERIPFRRLVWFFFRVSVAAFPAFVTVGFFVYATVIHAYVLLANVLPHR